ncbi:MAG: hypothetical protein V5A39_06225 [Haloarculaceae archaeon]
MRGEIERRGGTIEQVEIPARHEGLIGAETAHAIDAVLAFLDEPPLPEGELKAFLHAIQPEWRQLPNGRVFNAAEVNDVESTEMVRQALVTDEKTLPFVYLRRDRRGRTASFADYIDRLYEQGHIDRAHVGGANTRAFAENTDLPITRYDGNTVDEFMRELEQAVRTQEQAINEPAENESLL